MNRYICLHAHFYQPPRENPWLEEVELQDSAYPHHDWNARITAECYAPNAASRILDPERRIIDITNNYSRISFNFGPTLLSWLEAHEPEVYGAILEAHQVSKKRFGGHGSAIAQAYNHLIMPLANSRDKRTQVLWGVRDFEHRFGDRPEGMWLPETAVDPETLELLVDQGIKFTILAPRQAQRIREIGEEEWLDVSGDGIDPRRPYLCKLPSGNSIALFFYDGPIAQDIAFGKLLDDGRRFADRLASAFDEELRENQLVHVATDGETYGHHHRFGDMALSYCLYYLEEQELAQTTIYAQYLEAHPPTYEVEIYEDSSWSCVHGVERWKTNCGCNTGMHGGWTQAWRSVLRGALDWLRDSLILVYEEHGRKYFREPWAARDEYVEVVLDRSPTNVHEFLGRHYAGDLSGEDRTRALRLLELQRHAMLMYTSCGWFFDEISGIETVQVIQYAARAIQLAQEIAGIDMGPAFQKLLERAPSNIPELGNGATVYEKYVKPTVLNFVRVGAHYAVSSLFAEDHSETTDLYSFLAERLSFEKLELGRQRLGIGTARLQSRITHEETIINFVVLHLGEHNLLAGVRERMSTDEFTEVQESIKASFGQNDIAGVISLIDRHLGTHAYSLWHLFKDEQHRVMHQIVGGMLSEVETLYRYSYDRYYPIMQVTSDMQIPLPSVLSTTVSFVLNTDLRQALAAEPLILDELARLVSEARRWQISVDEATLGLQASAKCTEIMDQIEREPDKLELMKTLVRLLEILLQLPMDLDLWKVQNVYFRMSSLYREKLEAADASDDLARNWTQTFAQLGDLIQVKHP
jgi:alpha-amylase/alpha-mannosidase (GH57 family)